MKFMIPPFWGHKYLLKTKYWSNVLKISQLDILQINYAHAYEKQGSLYSNFEIYGPRVRGYGVRAGLYWSYSEYALIL